MGSTPGAVQCTPAQLYIVTCLHPLFQTPPSLLPTLPPPSLPPFSPRLSYFLDFGSLQARVSFLSSLQSSLSSLRQRPLSKSLWLCGCRGRADCNGLRSPESHGGQGWHFLVLLCSIKTLPGCGVESIPTKCPACFQGCSRMAGVGEGGGRA